MFTLKFSTDNDAFQGYNKEYEITRILTEITEKVQNGYTEGKIRDINGNTIGEWSM